MARKRKDVLSVVMTRGEALALGILRCSCGHPPNNHFDHGKSPCAHCDCQAYDEQVVLPKAGAR